MFGVVAALLLAACGGSSPKKSTGHRAGSFLAFSQCMRANGVTNFPDPATGGGIHLPQGINPTSPSFESAQATCQKKLPGGGPPTGPPSKQDIAQMVAVSRCMRQHGVTGFPDPTVSASAASPPNLNPANYSRLEDRGGVIVAIPKSINPTSPAFQQAAKACNFR